MAAHGGAWRAPPANISICLDEPPLLSGKKSNSTRQANVSKLTYFLKSAIQ